MVSARDVSSLLNELVNGPRKHGSEHVDLCVRYSTFSAFFEEHSLRIVRHVLADVRFSYFVRHYGEVPRRAADGADRHALVLEEDILDPDRAVGSVKVFLPECLSSQQEPNWMYFYDKVKDTTVSAAGTGAALHVIYPDDEWYAADLVEVGDTACPKPDEGLVVACAGVRQRLDYEVF